MLQCKVSIRFLPTDTMLISFYIYYEVFQNMRAQQKYFECTHVFETLYSLVNGSILNVPKRRTIPYFVEGLFFIRKIIPFIKAILIK